MDVTTRPELRRLPWAPSARADICTTWAPLRSRSDERTAGAQDVDVRLRAPVDPATGAPGDLTCGCAAHIDGLALLFPDPVLDCAIAAVSPRVPDRMWTMHPAVIVAQGTELPALLAHQLGKWAGDVVGAVDVASGELVIAVHRYSHRRIDFTRARVSGAGPGQDRLALVLAVPLYVAWVRRWVAAVREVGWGGSPRDLELGVPRVPTLSLSGAVTARLEFERTDKVEEKQRWR